MVPVTLLLWQKEYIIKSITAGDSAASPRVLHDGFFNNYVALALYWQPKQKPLAGFAKDNFSVQDFDTSNIIHYFFSSNCSNTLAN